MKLYRYFEDFGRMGSLDGVFFATDEEHDRFMGRSAYESDILGKHSEVEMSFNEETVEEIPLSEITIEEMFEVLGAHISGISPMEYFEQFEDEEYSFEDDEWDEEDE